MTVMTPGQAAAQDVVRVTGRRVIIPELPSLLLMFTIYALILLKIPCVFGMAGHGVAAESGKVGEEEGSTVKISPISSRSDFL